jgi:hypothetical protein
MYKGSARRVNMVARMMLGALFPLGSLSIGLKPRMVLGWFEGRDWRMA